MAAFFIDQIQFQRKTGFWQLLIDIPFFHFTSYRRTCILDDIWKTLDGCIQRSERSTPSLERISELHLQFQESFLATIFRYLSFVSREIIPILNSQGKDEEEAAALMGASGFTIFRKITLPQMKWGLIYGIILCSARALGEFGAVNALSKTRGETFTLPLEIDALYMSGTTSSITAAFAVSSVLVLIAVVVLILRKYCMVPLTGQTTGKGRKIKCMSK